MLFRQRPGKTHLLRHAAAENQLLIVKCNLCRRSITYLATDLVTVCDPGQPALTVPFACSKCRCTAFMRVTLTSPMAGDYGHIVVRRPGPVRRIQTWRDVHPPRRPALLITPSNPTHKPLSFDAAPPPPHPARMPDRDPPRSNNGPPLDDDPRPWGGNGIGSYFEWKAAEDRVWKDVPYDIAVMRARRAEALGLTYREYTLEILARGYYLSARDTERIAQIKRRRPLRD